MMLGMGDLSFDLSLGMEAMAGHPVLDACVKQVMDAAKNNNIPGSLNPLPRYMS